MCGVPVSRRRRLHRAAGQEGLPRRHLRAGRGSAEGQGPRQARGRPRRLAGHADRRQLPRRARAGVPDGGRAVAATRRVATASASRCSTSRPASSRAAEYAGADGCRRSPTSSRCCGRARSSCPATTATAPTRRRSPRGRRSRPPDCRSTRGRRLDVRAPRRRAARCSISCAPAASRASASTGTRRRSRPPARSSTTCATTQKVDLAHVRAITLPRSAPTRCSSIRPRSSISRFVEGSEGGRDGSLLDELDRTVTSMGSRLLRAWLLRPLVALEPIRDRLDAVEELAFRTTERGKFRDALKAVQDLERLVARAALGTAGPRDLVGLKQSLDGRSRASRTVLAELQAPLVRSLRRRARRPRRRARRDRAHADRRSAGAGARRRLHPRRRRSASSTSCGRSAARASRSSPRWRSASARAPASRR